MGGAATFALHEGDPKIKGGKWTVARFFLVSVAFTAGWLACSSQLGWYRSVYGPQVLLALNLAYCLPSIPLLVVSSYLDKPLENHLGQSAAVCTATAAALDCWPLLSRDRPRLKPRVCAARSAAAGVARTILVRLVVGLVGYGAVCGFFPFLPATIWWVPLAQRPPSSFS